MSSGPEISFTLNGQARRISVAPAASALSVLRDDFDLTAAKLACGEGECGACTILVDGISVCSCIYYAADLDGCEVETVEGLDRGAVLDPVQAQRPRDDPAHPAARVQRGHRVLEDHLEPAAEGAQAILGHVGDVRPVEQDAPARGLQQP